ncbi:hypothetical protein PAXINDRAFT_164933 [Paxillus involutus ATCC 200175]|nr:hypothetical protein PAXINDRAFT_164933 [Paxillus involutus ATCC 200175]
MSNRPSRSSSIPVRGTVPSSPARNIESVISIPFSTSPTQSRPRTAGQGWLPRNSTVHDHRATGIPHGVRGSSTVASSPPTRPTARSFTHSSVLFTPAGTAYPNTAYEPRVIRADSARGSDVTCPQSSSVSPTRARRPSATGVRAPSAQRSSVAHIPTPATEPVPFPRPAYLEHSALRHLLQTESPSLLPPRKAEPTVVRVDYTIGRRVQRSPSYDSDEDDMSPPREVRKSTPPPVTTSSPTLLLPTRWSDEYRSPHLTVCSDGRELIYQGTTGGSDKDVAPARTAVPVPPACGIFYYEVEITSKASKKCVHFIGQDVKMSRLPGWEKNSWGYHGDNGTICSGDKNGTSFGSTFGVGDIIGCGVDFTQNKVFYTKNGALLGTVFDNVGKDCDIFPAVGLCHPNESIHANFGQDPFKYDIEDHVLQQRNQTWANIQSTPLKWPADKFHERSTDALVSSTLEKAVAYGQELESDYKNRPEIRAIFKRTSVIMAYDDPLGAGGDAAEVAGQAARVALATELNQAILQSQGRPAQPLLDRLYRQAAVCLTQLALMGNGAAAFADMPKEFLDA